MLKKTIRPILLVLFLVIPTMASGQHVPPGKWWRDPTVVKKLNISDSEIQQLEEAFRDSRGKLIQLKSDVKIEQFELENLIDRKTLDDVAIHQQYEKLEKARAKLGAERFKFLIKIRKIVGNERFQELLLLKKKHRLRERKHRDQNSIVPKE